MRTEDDGSGSIVGSDKIGANDGKLFAAAGYEATLGYSRDPEKPRPLVDGESVIRGNMSPLAVEGYDAQDAPRVR